MILLSPKKNFGLITPVDFPALSSKNSDGQGGDINIREEGEDTTSDDNSDDVDIL